MSLLLRRSLIFIALLVAGLVLYTLWYGIKADRYDETAIPYLESALPRLTSWEYQQLRPMLSPRARLDFENEKVQAAYQAFSRLGQLKSMERPQFVANRFDSSDEMGDIEIVDYKVALRFDSGPAMIKLKLIADGESYFIHHFGIHSEQFVDQSGSN
ncbi:MAG: hypothetical protein GY802_26020 [Gammaproteobacteria bacterium]|nr:hypothetical protein [Gammaproteobacteria bacterium]